jgi:hypothetical protein
MPACLGTICTTFRCAKRSTAVLGTARAAGPSCNPSYGPHSLVFPIGGLLGRIREPPHLGESRQFHLIDDQQF